MYEVLITLNTKPLSAFEERRHLDAAPELAAIAKAMAESAEGRYWTVQELARDPRVLQTG